MHDYNTIIGVIRLRISGISRDKCRERYRIGSSSITLIMERFKNSGLTLQDLETMEPHKVVDLIYPPEKLRKKETEMPDFQAIYDRLIEKGSKVNLFYLWTEYKKETPTGYQYTQFVDYFNRYVKEHYAARNVTMAVNRIPGEKVYIDWVGDEPEIILNPETGEMKKAKVFITTVGVSSMIYAEVFPNEKLPNFVAGTVHAIEYYGAIPKYLVPDNASTAVTKHTKDELLINSTYQDLESFYDVIVLPHPPYKPRGKSTVEKYVQYIETWLLEKLKENVYTSFEAANAATKKIIADINEEIPEGWEYSRREMFERYDKPQMKALSDGSFTLCDYVSFNRVPENYHLPYDDHYYSVFYTYYGKPVILKATMTEIRICDANNRLICTHQRSYKKFPKYITRDEHMLPEHRYYKEVNQHNGDYYRRWASAIGKDMYTFIDTVLHSSKHEEQSYNSCNGILHMCDGISKLIANSAARKCVELKSCKYSYFKRILNDYLNNNGKETSESLPEHSNLWGKDFYK